MSVVEELKKQILLDGVEEEYLKSIAERVEFITFEEGISIFKEGEPTAGVYMIKSGEVEITKHMPVDLKTKMLITVRNLQNCCDIRKTPEGWSQVFAILIEGQFFGELSIIEGRRHHGADAKATEDTQIMLVRTEHFKEIEGINPGVMLKILKNIARVSSKNLRILDRQLLKLVIGY